MIRSLRTGVTGLRSNQLRLDVIGNNIAGVNTTGFKRSRVLFQDALSQRVASGGSLYGPTPTNPSNVGYGVAVSTIDQVWSQGSFEYTNLPTDLALAGDGFFVANSAKGPVLTRVGAFQFDGEGFLVTTGGLRVQGWMADSQGTINTGALQDIRVDPTRTSPPVRTTSMTVNGNLSAQRAEDAGPLTMSSVVYDGTGRAHTIVLDVEKTADSEWTLSSARLVGDPTATPPVPDTVLDAASASALTFDDEGNLTGGGDIALSGTFPDGSALAIDLDMSGLTQYSGSTTTTVTNVDGAPAGDLIDYGFDQEGRLVLAFSNGVRSPAAQLALGLVTNPDGMEQVGDGFYSASAASGDLQIGQAGRTVPAGVVAGALEASNVDLAEEFTDMIVAQRGYQANARIITTSDELLQETVQLKR